MIPLRRQGTHRLLALALAASCALAAAPRAARAQHLDQGGEPYAETPEELDARFWERDRELLHPGDPLRVVGLEQGENGIRAGTPALGRTDGLVALVDVDELYHRKLAMYAEGARLHAPPARRGMTVPVPRAARGARSSGSRRPVPAAETPSDSFSLTGVLALVLLGLLLVLVLRIRQQIA